MEETSTWKEEVVASMTTSGTSQMVAFLSLWANGGFRSSRTPTRTQIHADTHAHAHTHTHSSVPLYRQCRAVIQTQAVGSGCGVQLQSSLSGSAPWAGLCTLPLTALLSARVCV